MSVMQLNAIIIGSGKIGAFIDSPGNSEVLSYAHALTKYPKINLIGFYDKNKDLAKEAALKWGVKSFESLDSINTNIDLYIVASSDQSHYQILKQVSALSPKVVICEKPLTHDVNLSSEILSLYNKKQIPLFINYSRLYLKDFKDIKEKIDKGTYGSFLGGNAVYSKGLLHNGSHLLSLLIYFFNEIKPMKVLESLNDFSEQDLTRTLLLEITNQPFFMKAINNNFYSIFEIELLFEKSKIEIKDFGEEINIFEVTGKDSLNNNLLELTTNKTNCLDKQIYRTIEYVHNSINSRAFNNYIFPDFTKTLINLYKDINQIS